jgi:hypothetical protein
MNRLARENFNLKTEHADLKTELADLKTELADLQSKFANFLKAVHAHYNDDWSRNNVLPFIKQLEPTPSPPSSSGAAEDIEKGLLNVNVSASDPNCPVFLRAD